MYDVGCFPGPAAGAPILAGLTFQARGEGSRGERAENEEGTGGRENRNVGRRCWEKSNGNINPDCKAHQSVTIHSLFLEVLMLPVYRSPQLRV